MNWDASGFAVYAAGMDNETVECWEVCDNWQMQFKFAGVFANLFFILSDF